MPSPVDPDRQKRVSELLARCEASMAAGTFSAVVNDCRAILVLAPDNIRAKELLEEAQSKLEAEAFVTDNLKRAQEYFQAREYQKCISECQKIQLLDPDNKPVAELLGKAHEKQEAEPFIQNFVHSGNSLMSSGLYNEAIAQWEKVRSIDPQYPGLDDMIKSARQKAGGGAGGGSVAPAASSYGEVDEKTLATSMNALGEDQDFGGVQFGEAGGGTDDGRIAALLKEGDALYVSGQYQKAIEVLSEIFMLDINHAEALQKIEVARAALSRQQQKVRDLVKGGQAAYESGDSDQAGEFFKQARALDPENRDAARGLSQLGETETPALSVAQLVSRGDEAESRGQLREAAQYFSQALAIDSENAALADRIKNLNLQVKKQEQSKGLLGNARAFVAEGKLDSARHALTKILEVEPNNEEAIQMIRELGQTNTVGTAAGGISIKSSGKKGVKGSRSKLPLPLPLPILGAAAAVLLIAIVAAVYFFVFRKSDTSSPIVTKKPVNHVVRPTIKKPAPTKTSTKPNPVANHAAVSQELKDKAAKLTQEAKFYFESHQLPQALDMVTEALRNDPDNKDAAALKTTVEKAISEQKNQEQKLLNDADAFFGYSEFAGAVRLYQKYLEQHPDATAQVQPKIIKCYYNLGVIAIRTYNCERASQYFRQVLFIDPTDQLSKDALDIAHLCQKAGSSDLEVRKAIALMDIRK